MINRHPLFWLVVMSLVLLGAFVIAASMGAMPISLRLLRQSALNSMSWQIWLNIRLPRVLLAVLVGSALALSGAVMQGLFRNPLADPGLLGVSSGAGLAVAIAVVIPFTLPGVLSLWLPVIAAFIGSLIVILLIFHLSKLTAGDLSRLLLVGIAINALCGAAVGILSWISNDQQLRQLSLWGMGSLGQAHWATLWIASIVILPSALLMQRFAMRLNLLQLGEEDAHYVGVSVLKTQQNLLLLSALLVGAAVALSGVIGFIGLVVPHVMRFCFGSDHRWMLPASALCGAMLLLVADTFARIVVSPAEMPVGLLTSLLGGPWFFWLIIRHQRSIDG